MLYYIEGPCNILANNLSSLHHLSHPGSDCEGEETRRAHSASNGEEDEAYFLDQEYSGHYDNDVW
jgi:hypothetical protein